jgi:hypothetical protein
MKGAPVRLLDQLVEERAELSETVEGILTRAADETRDLTETEDKNLTDLKARADALDERITELRAVQVANLEAAKLRAEVAATDEPEARAAAGVVQVHSEPITYSERTLRPASNATVRKWLSSTVTAPRRTTPASWSRST